MEDKPLISVIIPCRNEEKFIGKTLDSLIGGDYPNEKLEILVVDGASEDKTKAVVAEYTKKYPFIKILDNPKRITPVAMNIGIKNAKGEIVTKTDAHSNYPNNYLSLCLKVIKENNADVVGGIAAAMPSRETNAARAIARSLGSPLGSGNAAFRKGVKEPPREADAVFGSCYKKEVFDKVGLFNENLTGSQDIDMTTRIRKTGGKVFLLPELIIEYFPKPTYASFFRHNIKDGIWAILPSKHGSRFMRLRHLVPLFFVGGILTGFVLGFFFKIFLLITIGVLLLYLALAILQSIKIARVEKEISMIPYLIAAFAVRHFGYGIGSLIGLVKLIL